MKIVFRHKAFIYNAFVSLAAVLFLLMFICPNELRAEGTKEIMPYDSCVSRINLEPSFTNFAMYNCLPSERLHIHIENIGEKIYYGFGDILDANQIPMTDVKYQIRDPNGNIVVMQTPVPSMGIGYIPSYLSATAGPNALMIGGYNALSYTPATTGDYYIEFDYIYGNMGGDRREFVYFDITVASSFNVAIPGRVWSKEWQFTVTSSGPFNPYDNPFYGELYVYSDDSIVTSVDFNGIKPYVFAVSANSTGTSNTGNIMLDRKSVAGRSTYPQYKVFLNNPDILVYPSGIIGMFLSPISFDGCPGNHCINVDVSKAGAIQLLIDLNGIPGYQIGTEDILIVQNVAAGQSCIPWNGLNGLGNIVSSGTVVNFFATYVSGLTHLPIYDAEHNPNGFKIGLVRPISTSTSFNLYWDDSNFSGAVTPPSNGCNSTSGCHVFNNMFGDMRTINTWWYAASNIQDSLTIVYRRILIDSLQLTDASCPNKSDGEIRVFASGGTLPYTYSVNGNTPQASAVFSNLSIGNYLIEVVDSNNCTTTAQLTVSSSPNLVAALSSIADTCNMNFGSLSCQLISGTQPVQYQWNTTPVSTTSSITNLNAGSYTLSITDAYNCVFTFTDTVDNISSNIQIVPTVFHDTCSNSMGQIHLAVSNGLPPINFEWNTFPTQSTANAINLAAGIYSITITENGYCKTIQQYQVLDMPAPSPLFELPDKACVGDSVTLQYIGNQTPPDNYTWNFNSAMNLLGTGLGPFALRYTQTGKHFIRLDVSKIGCPSSTYVDSIELFQLQLQTDSVKAVNCFGGNDGYWSVQASGGVMPYSYWWTPFGIGNSFNDQLYAGQYQVLVTDSIGCKDNIASHIVEPLALQTLLTPTDASCSYSCDGQLHAQVQGGNPPYLYQWTPSGFGNIASIHSLCTGNYSLNVIDAKGCSVSQNATINYSVLILADFSHHFRTDFSERFIADFSFTGFGASNYFWDFGDNSSSMAINPSHFFPDDDTYRIELIVNSGMPHFCYDTVVKTITVEPPFNVYVPNAFTPNGDGINDFFRVVATRVKTYHIYIYNRWGELLFESQNMEEMWGGLYRMEKVPQDVYTYFIEVVGENDKKYSTAGTVVLYR